jgi:hypothetical protein
MFFSNSELVASVTSLFEPAPRPLFRAHGTYSAVLQLVYLAETDPRPVSISVHMTMLADASLQPHSVSQGQLIPVFHRVQSTSCVTGDHHPTRMWLMAWVQECMEWMFIVPLTLLRVGRRLVLEDGGGALFPPLNADSTSTLLGGGAAAGGLERSITVPLYEQFHPPLPLQDRLAALNVTILQRYVSASDANRGNIHLVRAHVAFQVELEGLAYFMTRYPFLSSVATTSFFFVSFALWCACVAIGVVSGGVYLAINWKVLPRSRRDLGDDGPAR